MTDDEIRKIVNRASNPTLVAARLHASGVTAAQVERALSEEDGS